MMKLRFLFYMLIVLLAAVNVCAQTQPAGPISPEYAEKQRVHGYTRAFDSAVRNSARIRAEFRGDAAPQTYAPGVVTQNITYFVCSKANGGTCVYNGDGGTVAATIADTNDCLTKATPCRTISGAEKKIHGMTISAVVTIQLADAAGTGTDLYEPNGTIFSNKVNGNEPDLTLEIQERTANTLGTYPTAYIYLKGNDTTPGNVALCGSSSCSTTATDTIGVVFTGTTARISGIGAKNFLIGPSSTAFQLLRSLVYLENSTFTGTNVASDQEYLSFAADNTTERIGGTLTVTNGGLVATANYAQVNFRTPAGRANVTGSVSGSFNNGMVDSNENSYIAIDGCTMSWTGAGTYTIFQCQNHSTIYWNDDSTFTTPTWSFTANGAGITVNKANQQGFIHDGCRTAGQLTCNVGNTTAVAVAESADMNSTIFFSTNAAGATTQNTGSHNSTIIGPSTGTQVTIVYLGVNKPLLGDSAPTISSGFGSSPSIVAHNSWQAFQVNVGTGGTATSGVINVGTTAPTGWVCTCTDVTTNSATVFLCKQTASSTTTATVGNFNTSGVAAAWVASNVLNISCFPF